MVKKIFLHSCNFTKKPYSRRADGENLGDGSRPRYRARTLTMSSSYPFYYLNEVDHIVDADWASCGSDAAAIARARAMLLRTRQCRVVEIWQGTRRVEAIATAS
jgi:hypothetical protein